MKKIIMVVAAIAVVTGLFAVDFSATVNMGGDIVNGTFDFTGKKDAVVNALKVNDTGLNSSKEILSFTVSGDKSGSSFNIGTKSGTWEDSLNIRNLSIWVQPIDMIKVTIGSLDEGTYKERIEWWKAGKGEAACNHNKWAWSSTASVSGVGINLNVYPISGLEISLGVAPGAGVNFITSAWDMKDTEDKDADGNVIQIKDKWQGYKAYGAFAKYQVFDWLSVAVSWKDAGYKAEKTFAVGADFGNWGTPYYGFLNVRALFDKLPLSLTKKIGATDKDIASNSFALEDVTLTGIAFDNYVKYNFGFMTLEGRFPVTIRGLANPTIEYKGKTQDLYKLYETFGVGTKSDFDPCWMSFGIKATLPLGPVNVYVYVYNDTALTFNSKFVDNMELTVKPGVTMSVGACALDIALQADFTAGFKGLNWSVPFTAKIGF